MTNKDQARLDLIHIDQPTNWQSMDLGAVISGWIATSDSLDAIRISIDGVPARFHLIDRPDVRAAHAKLAVTGFLVFYSPARKAELLTIELKDVTRSEIMTMSSTAEKDLAELSTPMLKRPKGTFFRIRTSTNSRLSVNMINGYICHIDAYCTDARFVDLIGYVTSERESTVFLLAPSFMRVSPDVVHYRILPMGMCRTSPPQMVSLYDLQHRVWLCAVPHMAAVPHGVVVDRVAIAEWERLTLEELGEDLIPPTYRLAARRVDELLALPLGSGAIVGLDERDAASLSAVGLVSREAEWWTLAQDALGNSRLVEALARVFPGDYYLRGGLERLLLSHQGDRSRAGATREIEILPEVSANDLSRDSKLKLRHDNPYTYHSFTFALNAVARQLVRPRKRFCVMATARNEGPYLLEWISWYLYMGMDTVLIYTNNNTDGSDDLLTALHAAGVIHWVRNEVEEGTVAQHKAYAHAFAVSPVTIDHEWVLTVDLDEFLVIDRNYFPSLHEWVFWLERHPVDAIAINWRFCGPNGRREWSDDFIMRRFSGEDAHVDQTIKTMCRPQRVISSNEHFPVSYYRKPLSFVSESGAPHVGVGGHLAFSTAPSGRYAWINHYWCKSAQEFLWKWSRNRGNEPLITKDMNTLIPPFALENFARNFARANQPTAEILAAETAVLGIQQELLGLPGVKEASATIRSQFTQQLIEIQDRLLSSPSILDGGEYGDAFLRIMGMK